MNKKIITGAILALAAGIAAFVYNRRRNRLSTTADSYNSMDNAMYNTGDQTEQNFS